MKPIGLVQNGHHHHFIKVQLIYSLHEITEKIAHLELKKNHLPTQIKEGNRSP